MVPVPLRRGPLDQVVGAGGVGSVDEADTSAKFVIIIINVYKSNTHSAMQLQSPYP